MQFSDQLTEALLLLFLFVLSCRDYRTRLVSTAELAAGGGAGVLFRLLAFGMHPEGQSLISLFLDMMAGSGIGLFLLLIGYASHEAVGYGDGLLLAVTGLYLGWRDNLLLLLTGLLLSALSSAALLFLGRKKREDRIPFVPFLLGAYLLLLAQNLF